MEQKIQTFIIAPHLMGPLNAHDNHSYFHACNSPRKYPILQMDKLLFINVQLRAQVPIDRKQQRWNQTQVCLVPNPRIFPPGDTTTLGCY